MKALALVAALLTFLAGCAGRQVGVPQAATIPAAGTQTTSPASDQTTSEGISNPESEAIRQIVDKVVALSAGGRLDSPEARELLTGEALARWNTPTLGRISGKASKIIQVRDDFAVARVTASAGQEKKDFYFYATKTPSWKVSAMRTLMVGLAYSAREQLRARQNAPGREADLRNLDLTLSTDDQLKVWLLGHRDALSTIMRTTEESKRAELCRSLGISAVRIESSGSVAFIVGGILDNSVGFLYLAAPASPPEIDTKEYIWVEQVAADWYLFRTT